MTPFFAVLTHDTKYIYVSLYTNEDVALAYANSNKNHDNDARIVGVCDPTTCNNYLAANNGYLAKIFEGPIKY